MTIKALTIDLAPWAVRNESGFEGPFYEPMQLILEKLGKPFIHKVIPLKRALSGMTEDDGFDLALFTPGPHSKNLIDLGVVLKGVQLIFLPRKGLGINKIDDITTSTKIGTPRGISAATPILTSGNYQLVFVDDNTSGLKMLKKNRLDGYLETNISISSVADRIGLVPAQYDPPIVLVEESQFHGHLYLNKKSKLSKEVQSDISKILKELRERKKFQVFVEKSVRWLSMVR